MTLKSCSVKTILLITLTVLPTWLMAGDNNAQHTASEQESSSQDLVLRSIMRELDQNMREVVGAISRENWEQVNEIASRIADHAEPPFTEKTRILRFVGTDAARFRGHDRQVHEAAMEMGEKARHEDGEAVIEAFSRVQKHCLACHQEFKEEFRAYFYGE
ncbi:cytochrome c [Methylophaga nitratireducenticrescens]|uniref:Cytochrome C n=1 Tax=Methylophaga nitratireducenticrescens TaxID=754476 RepID=I1XHH7_METNJ|nr:cytochrome c [Methylophaga nitratireducenticrescens]